jgi:hypothetical protein
MNKIVTYGTMKYTTTAITAVSKTAVVKRWCAGSLSAACLHPERHRSRAPPRAPPVSRSTPSRDRMDLGLQEPDLLDLIVYESVFFQQIFYGSLLMHLGFRMMNCEELFSLWLYGFAELLY